jgi:hypothetical protein
MSSGHFEVQVTGVVIKTPEVKTSKAGNEYISFTIGTTRSSKKGNDWENEKLYHNFFATGNTVNFVKKISKMDIVRAVSTSVSHTVSDEKKVYTTYMLSSFAVIQKAQSQSFAKSESDGDDISADIPF